MSDSRNYDIERAVGMLCYHLHRGDDDGTALAKVTERIPQLTRAETRLALQWAQAACRTGEILNDPNCTKTLGQVMDECGVPWRECR